MLISSTCVTSPYLESLVEFWRNFEANLISAATNSKRIIDELQKYGVLSILELYVVQFQRKGENTNDLLLYLLKINIKYSWEIRHKFTKFLKENNFFNAMRKQWIELSKILKFL